MKSRKLDWKPFKGTGLGKSFMGWTLHELKIWEFGLFAAIKCTHEDK